MQVIIQSAEKDRAPGCQSTMVSRRCGGVNFGVRQPISRQHCMSCNLRSRSVHLGLTTAWLRRWSAGLLLADIAIVVMYIVESEGDSLVGGGILVLEEPRIAGAGLTKCKKASDMPDGCNLVLHSLVDP